MHTHNFLGGYGGGDLPDPISNSVVKPSSVDGTAQVTVWESRTPPGSYHGNNPIRSQRLNRELIPGGVLSFLALAIRRLRPGALAWRRQGGRGTSPPNPLSLSGCPLVSSPTVETAILEGVRPTTPSQCGLTRSEAKGRDREATQCPSLGVWAWSTGGADRFQAGVPRDGASPAGNNTMAAPGIGPGLRSDIAWPGPEAYERWRVMRRAARRLGRRRE